MRQLTILGGILGSAALMLAQVNHAGNAAALNPVRPMPVPSNMPAYGNVLFPGGNPNPSFPAQLGATVAGRPYGYGPGYGPGYVGGGPNVGGYGGGGRGRTVVVPYAVPVYYSGYGGAVGYGYDGYGPQQPATNVTVVVPQQPAPSVIINQTFTNGEPTSGELRDYSPNSSSPESSGGLKSWEPKRSMPTRTASPVSASADDGSYARDGKATIYLIALKDSTVRQAIGFWLEGNMLAYVTPEASIQRVSMDKVDRDLSVQLNSERNLDFELRQR